MALGCRHLKFVDCESYGTANKLRHGAGRRREEGVQPHSGQISSTQIFRGFDLEADGNAREEESLPES